MVFATFGVQCSIVAPFDANGVKSGQNEAVNFLSLRERVGVRGLQVYPERTLTPHPRLRRDLSLRER